MTLLSRTLSISMFCLSAALLPGVCRASETVTANGLNIVVSAVDKDTFHLVTYPVGNPVPPASPFVVETSELPGSAGEQSAAGSAMAETSHGELVVDSSGGLRLNGTSGRAEFSAGRISAANGAIMIALTHDSGERIYGAGNAGMNTAGDLTHSSGTSGVSNGATRIPFLWTMDGWSCLVANNQTGTSWSDDGKTLTWTIPAPYADVYLSVATGGSGGYELLDAYSRLTGGAPIPPRWTLGFMLSRWGYVDAADVQDKWHQFRERQIPVDAFIYDYDWFINDWEFNPVTFPDPKANLAEMKRLGLHFVGIRKPRVNGANQAFARSQGWLLDSSQGTDLRFDVPASRYWWWSHHAPLVEDGVSGWWNDEAEQSGDEFFYMAKAEWDGWHAAKNTRPWSISRAFAPGMQRFGAAAWTGDIDSSWSALANQPGTLLNWSLAGFPYVGQDTGGFQSTPTPELYARWIEEAVFVPVMRAHGTLNSPRWPWAFGDDVLAATKKAIELRYRLIPYYYTFAAQTEQTGAPLMRPLFLEFPDDAKTYNMEDEWLMGDRLLAAPVLTQGGARDVYLPAGGWFDFNTGASVSGGQTLHLQPALGTIPAYARAGTILPLGPVIQSTSLGAEDPLEVRVYPGQDATFTLYEDDGSTYAYRHGACSRIPMRWDNAARTLTVGARQGSFMGMPATRHLVVVLPDGEKRTAVYTGASLRVRL